MDQQALITAILAAVPDAIAIYLFGSAARGEALPGSDLDLAFLAPRPLDELLRWELQERLAAIAGRDVDLVDLRAASTVMRVQVICADRLLAEVDGYERALFEAYALSDYARLNEERRGILEDVRRTGRIHE